MVWPLLEFYGHIGFVNNDEILLWFPIVAPNSISRFDKKWHRWDQSCHADKFNNHNPSQVDRSSL